MSRKTAREIAMKILFQMDFHEENIIEKLDEIIQEIKEEKIHDDKPLHNIEELDVEYIKDVVSGTINNLSEIDKRIDRLSIGWQKDRIAKVDLAILRLAIYEIIHRDDVPKQVAINEAVELAKKYSTEESKGFVNGILAKIED